MTEEKKQTRKRNESVRSFSTQSDLGTEGNQNIASKNLHANLFYTKRAMDKEQSKKST